VTLTAPTLDNLTLNITQEILVHASIEATFEALLEQIGPGNETPEGQPLPMVIEPRPGGRWFRDLGHGDGHFWGHVQAIKRPSLLEITGPLFMSAPVVSNVQYRLKENGGDTLIQFRHSAFGVVPDDVRNRMADGWAPLLARIRKQAEGGHGRR
jgi:Activator of Hsp90 ATPase homolog 1-like protein